MKLSLLCYALLFAVTAAHGNPVIMQATLIGETVSVRMAKDVARVTAVYQFGDGVASAAKRVYFPIFAAESADPIAVLRRSGLELEFNGEPAGEAVPCEPPHAIEGLPRDVRVCWFAADIDELHAAARD